MERLEQLRQAIDHIIRENPDPQEARCGFVHLYGVSAICLILALKRGLDLELCTVAGILHDIWNYKVGDCPEHAKLGAEEAKVILLNLGSFTPDEIDIVCHAIARHRDKLSIDSAIDELLKDADVFQHYLYNPAEFIITAHSNPDGQSVRLQRLERVFTELGIKVTW